MANFYTTEQEELLGRLLVIRSCVFEQPLYGSPCPLMLSQLYELKVFTEKLAQLTRQMIDVTKDRDRD